MFVPYLNLSVIKEGGHDSQDFGKGWIIVSDVIKYFFKKIRHWLYSPALNCCPHWVRKSPIQQYSLRSLTRLFYGPILGTKRKTPKKDTTMLSHHFILFFPQVCGNYEWDFCFRTQLVWTVESVGNAQNNVLKL